MVLKSNLNLRYINKTLMILQNYELVLKTDLNFNLSYTEWIKKNQLICYVHVKKTKKDKKTFVFAKR